MGTLFYRNPRIMILTVSLILVAGLSSLQLLPRMEDPLLTPRFAMVTTLLPGADAERVESLVSEELEDAVREVEEIKEVRTVSRVGVSIMTIELRDAVDDVDPVWSRIRDRINDATPRLPSGALTPEFEELDVKAYASLVALTWHPPRDTANASRPPRVNHAILRRLAEELEDALTSLPGTEDVDLFGDPDEEILVEVDVRELTARALTVDGIAQQIAASDSKVSAGRYRGRSNLLLEVDGELESLDRVRRTPIRAAGDGRFVLLGDLAEVTRTVREPPSSLAIVDGRSAVVLGAMVRPGVRIDHWAADADAAVAEFAETLPTGVGLSVVFRQNRYVESRLTGLQQNLFVGAVAVALVVLVLMGWRSALIVATALPLSALIVLAGMRVLEIPIHQMSVTGLIVALGLLIDNAIVMADDVRGRLRAGRPPVAAVAESVRHLAIPLSGSTITTALAFAPIALMPGPAGEFVGSIAVSVILAITGSLFISLTVVPALAARAAGSGQQPRRARWWTDGVQPRRLTAWYDRSLRLITEFPTAGVTLGVLLPVIGFLQLPALPEQFFPPADRDQFQIEVDLPAQMSVAETRRTVTRMRDVLLSHDAIDDVSWFIGESAPSFYYNLVPRRRNSPSYAQALVQTRSRHASAMLLRDIQAELDAAFPEARTLVRLLEQGPPFDAPVELRIFGPDLTVLRRLGEELRRILADIPVVTHTRSDLEESVPKVALQLMEEEARLAGLTHAEIARQLDRSLEGAVGGSILESTEELPVRVRVSERDRSRLDRIRSLELLTGATGPDGNPVRVPLSAIAEATVVPEVSSITRLDGRRMNEVQAYLDAGVLPAVALAEFRSRLQESGHAMPAGYTLSVGGEAAERNESVGNLLSSVGILGVMMVATLVLSFGSFRMAAIVGCVAALSAGLGFGALRVFGYPFGFMAIIGTMGLIGVAINDSIVVLAAIREDTRSRAGSPAAVRRVVLASTRHVVATTFTTIAGFLPLLLGGGGFWPPLAVTIAGGVGGATLLALYFAPSAYILVMCRGCHAPEHADDIGRQELMPETLPA